MPHKHNLSNQEVYDLIPKMTVQEMINYLGCTRDYIEFQLPRYLSERLNKPKPKYLDKIRNTRQDYLNYINELKEIIEDSQEFTYTYIENKLIEKFGKKSRGYFRTIITHSGFDYLNKRHDRELMLKVLKEHGYTDDILEEVTNFTPFELRGL